MKAYICNIAPAMKQQEFSFTLAEIDAIAEQLLKQFPSERIFYFKGTLGAGKTTFIKALCKCLGIEEALSSPSFSIVNEYAGELHSKAFHMDLYRLKNIQEAEAIGLYEYFDSGQYCFVEWPEIVENYQNGITLNFDIVDAQTRKLTISN